MKIKAVRGDSVFLVEISDGNGVVVDIISGAKSGEKPIDSFLRFGYWEHYSGPLTAEQALGVI